MPNQADRILLTDPRYFEVNPDEVPKWRLETGDVLMIEGNGSADQVGRTALFRGEIQVCVHQNHIIRIRPDRTVVDPEFLNLFLNSPLWASGSASSEPYNEWSARPECRPDQADPCAGAFTGAAARDIILHNVASVRNVLSRLSKFNVSEQLGWLLPSILSRSLQPNRNG